MTGAYSGGLQLSAATDLGTTTATSAGVSLVSSASTYTKGSWVQLTASLAQDASWMMVYIQSTQSFGSNFAIDVGTGGSGSESVVVSNLSFSTSTGAGHRYMFPLTIPAGTRVAARVSSNASSDTVATGFMILSDSYQSAGCASAIDTYGFSASTNIGTAVDPGSTANTKGAYAQITASTAADIGGIFIKFDYQNNASGSTQCFILVDIAVGGSGSEVVILPNITLYSYQNGSIPAQMGAFVPYVPVQISAGSRIAVRAQSSTNVSPDRIFGCTIWGVRL